MKPYVFAVLIVSALAVFPVWKGCRNAHFDDPSHYAALAFTVQPSDAWTPPEDVPFGVAVKIPPGYRNVKDVSGSVAFRQHTQPGDDAKTLGKRIGLELLRLESVAGTGIFGIRIDLSSEVTLTDIQHQLLEVESRPSLELSCQLRQSSGREALICIARAPGSMSFITGGKYHVCVLEIHETEKGSRILVLISNDAGATPYARDRDLRRELLGIHSSLRGSGTPAL